MSGLVERWGRWGCVSSPWERLHFRKPAILSGADCGIDRSRSRPHSSGNLRLSGRDSSGASGCQDVNPKLPVVAQVTIDEDGNCLDGSAPEIFVPRLAEWGADVIGCNCSVGPVAMLDAMERVRARTTLPIAAQPNAGIPRSVEGRNIYLCSPEYMASYARKFVAAGVNLVGGCCGTTPEHIQGNEVGLARRWGARQDRHRPGAGRPCRLHAPAVP